MEKFVKCSLGSNAMPNSSEETRRAIEHVRSEKSGPTTASLTDEEWIVQERLEIGEEYRVHTVETSIVPELTFYRHSSRPCREERRLPNDFVASVVERLPQAFLAETICGWDVCQTTTGVWKIVEINFGGFHPVVDAGFQCSGFFVREPWCTYLVARLMGFVERKYGLSFISEGTFTQAGEVSRMYAWIRQWRELFHVQDLIKALDRVDLSHMNGWQPTIQDLSAQETFRSILGRLRRTVALNE